MRREILCNWLVGIVLVVLAAAFVDAQTPDPVKKATADLAAAEKAASEAAATKTLAEKSLADRAAVAQTAAASAAAAKTAADQRQAEKAAAEKALQEKTAAATAAAARVATAKAAVERATAEQRLRDAAAAQAAVLKAEEEKAVAERTLEQKLAACKSTAATAATTRAAADRAASEVAALKKTLETVTAAAKAGVTRSLQEKTTAAQKAADRADAAQKAAAQAAAEKTAAEQALAGKTAAIRDVLAQAAAARAAAYGGLRPLPASAWDHARARHLLVRAGFGGTPDEVARLHEMGLHQAVASLVHFTRQPAPDIPFVAALPERPEPHERMLSAADQNRVSQRRQAQEARQIQGIRTWWLRRMAESPRPLEEKLTLFWHGHFACEYETVFQSYFMYRQNEMFRQHAAGNFGALLHGLVHDPTMLRYLNNDTNLKGKPNENLAREIMELFALGLGNYTEEDIRQAAKALTGYTYDHWSGQFRFHEARHDTGPKTIFGKTGTYTGDDLVDLILQQPSTARFIARKLFLFFAHENPEPETVERLAAVLRASNYELTPLLENLFTSEEFYSPRAMGTQIKSPVQLMIGAVRELGIKDANYAFIAQAIRSQGQDLLQPPNVKGWDGGRTWVDASRVFLRYNAMAELLEAVPRSGGQRGVDLVGTLLACKTFRNTEEVVDYLVRCCLANPLASAKRQGLIEFVGTLPPPAEWPSRKDEVNARLTALLVLLMSSPEYQLT